MMSLNIIYIYIGIKVKKNLTTKRKLIKLFGAKINNKMYYLN